MAVDELNSIYVGGLPYDCSEDTIRKAFDPYGSIVAVKIINDHDVGGKCYGFVTFTNSRCVDDAINSMNGRKIGGRIVKVNEVKTRGVRPHFNRENNRHDPERKLDWDRDRDRDRERDHNYDRDRYRDRSIGRIRDRGRELEPEFERPRGRDRSREHFVDEDRYRDQDRANSEKDWRRNQDRDVGENVDLDWERNRALDRTNDNARRENSKDKELQTVNRNGSHFTDRRSREPSSNSSDDYQDQVKEQLELSVQKQEELQKEISLIQGKLDERERYVSDLQKRSQKLEDSLATAKKLSSEKRMQLAKIQRCIQQVNDYSTKLKSSEQELKSLVDFIMVEADDLEDAAVMDGSVYINGKA